MTMPVINFDQNAGLKWLQGVQGGQGIVNTLFDAPLKRKSLSEQIEAQNIANQMSQQKAAIEPQSLQAQLEGLRAGTAETQEKTRLAPLTAAVSAQQALSTQAMRQQQIGTRYTKARDFVRAVQAMPAATRAGWIAENQDQWNSALALLGNRAMQEKATQQMPNIITSELLTKSGLPGYQAAPVAPAAPGAPAPPTAPPAAAPTTLSAQLQQQTAGAPPSAAPTETPPFAPDSPTFTVSKATNDQMRKLNELYVNRAMTTNQTKMREEAGTAVETLLAQPNIRQSLVTLSQFQGAQGAARLLKARATNPEEYAKALSALHQLTTVLSGSVKTLEGFGATDKGMQSATNFLRTANNLYATNPDAAISYINQGIGILNSEAKALQTAAEPIFKVKRVDAPEIKPISAQKAAPATPLNVPTFQSKANFESWYQGLSPAEQTQYRATLGAK